MAFRFGIIGFSGFDDPDGIFGGSENSSDGAVGSTLTFYTPVYSDATTVGFPDDAGSELTEDFAIEDTTYAAGSNVEANYEVIFYNPETGYYHRITGIWIDNTYVGVVVSRAWDATTGEYVYGADGMIEPGDTLVAIDGDDLDGTPNIEQFATDTNYTGIVGNDAILNSTNGTPVCYLGDTLIETPDGQKPIRDLKVGDLVMTADHGAQPLIWVGQRRYSTLIQRLRPEVRPVRVSQGALGAGLPHRTLHVSQPHRLLVRSKIAKRMFDADEVFVPARRLTGLDGIQQDGVTEVLTYHHILCARHEIIFAEGAPSETLLPGPQAQSFLGRSLWKEVKAVTKDLPEYLPARPIAPVWKADRLRKRHEKNNRDLIVDVFGSAAAAS